MANVLMTSLVFYIYGAVFYWVFCTAVYRVSRRILKIKVDAGLEGEANEAVYGSLLFIENRFPASKAYIWFVIIYRAFDGKS